MNKKNVLVMVLAMLLVCVMSVGGTIAWLTATTSPVINTFTSGNVAITLNEGEVYELGATGTTDANLGTFTDDGATRVMDNTYQIIPGNKYDKDPTVTVKANSEDCYLFVKFEEGNAANYLTYTSTLTTENDWTQGDGATIPANVWYRVVDKATTDQSWVLLQEQGTAPDTYYLEVKSDITNGSSMTNAAASELKWTAYAIQKANIANAATAWTTLGVN